MDEVKIRTGFMKDVISRLASKYVKKELGIDMGIDISRLEASFDSEYATVNLGIGLKIQRDDLGKLLREIL